MDSIYMSRREIAKVSKEPQRRNGRLRVAMILSAATDLIADKGYASTTMAEIAARSDTRIGSLYRFFPNKESIANAMIMRYLEKMNEAFSAIENRIHGLSVEALVDAFFDSFADLRKEGAAIMRLMDAHEEWLARQNEFRKNTVDRISRIFLMFHHGLDPDLARNMARVVIHNMKTMKMLIGQEDSTDNSGFIRELRTMTCLYIHNRLDPDGKGKRA